MSATTVIPTVEWRIGIAVDSDRRTGEMVELVNVKTEYASKQDMGKAIEGLCSCGAEIQDCDMGGYCNECDTVWVYKEIA